MNKNTNCLASAGVITLAVFATAFGAGCTGSSTPPTGEATSAITSTGITTNGCSGSAEFHFTSDQDIGYIAVDRSDFSGMKMKLYAVDESGSEKLMEEEAQEVDTAMQSMLDASSNNTNASQRSSSASNDSASHDDSMTGTESSDHHDESDSYEDSTHEDESDGTQSSDRSEENDDDDHTGSSSASSDSSQSQSNTSKSGKSASESNDSSKTKTTTSSNSSDRSAQAAADSASSNGSTAEHKATSEASQSRTHHLVFKHLETAHSKHFVLHVEMEADENSEMMRAFTGSESKHVSSQQDFTGSFPQCAGNHDSGDDDDDSDAGAPTAQN